MHHQRGPRVKARGAHGALVALLLSASGCAGPASGSVDAAASASESAEVEACSIALEDLGGFEPRDAPRAPSRLALQANVDLKALLEIANERVPRGLASASNKTVASGVKASYDVSRGDITAELKGEDLLVVIPVAASASVCKTLGSLCINLGSCNPTLKVTSRARLTLAENFAIKPPEVSSQMGQPCSIAGFSATSKIASQAQSEAKKAEKQIRAALPDVPAELGRLLDELRRPVALDEARCVEVEPVGAEQGTPSLAGNILSQTVAVRARVTDRACAMRPGPAPQLGKLEMLRSEEPLASELRIYQALDLAPLRASLEAALAPVGTLTEMRTTAGPEGRAALAVDMMVSSGEVCGPVRILLALGADAAGASPTLRVVDAGLGPGSDPKAVPISERAREATAAWRGPPLQFDSSERMLALLELARSELAPHGLQLTHAEVERLPPALAVEGGQLFVAQPVRIARTDALLSTVPPALLAELPKAK